MFRYADPEACPACRAPIAAGTSRCDTCGIQLSGPVAVNLFRTLTHADGLVAELLRLSATSTVNRTAPQPVLAGVVAGSMADAGPAAAGGPMPSFPVPAHPSRAGRRTPRLTAASGPKILLGLGALCLLVAAVVFLAVAWSALGVGGRTGVLVAATVAAGAAATFLARRDLRGGAEAFTTVALGLLTLDVLGAQSAGWLDAVSDAGFVVLLGTVVAATSLAAALAARRTPMARLWSAQAGAGIGALVAVIGVHIFVDGDAAFVIALLLTAACTWAAHRLGLTVSTAILGVGTLCWWLVTLGRGLAAIDTSPTFAEVWGGPQTWLALVAAGFAAAPALVRALPRGARVVGLAAGVALIVVLLTAPVMDESLTRVALVSAVVALGGAGALGALPGAWRWIVAVPVVVAGLVQVVIAVLLGNVAGTALTSSPTWGGGIGVHLEANSLRWWEPLLLPLAVAVGLVAIGVGVSLLAPLVHARFAPARWIGAGGLVAVSTIALLPAMYDVPAALTLASLLILTAVAGLVATRSRSEITVSTAAVVVTFASLGAIAVSLANDVLTAVATGLLTVAALGMAAGGGAGRTGATRSRTAQAVGEVGFAPLVAGFTWTLMHLAGIDVEWRAAPILVILGAWSTLAARPAREVPAVVAGLVATCFSLAMTGQTDGAQASGVASVQSWLAIDLTVAGVLAAITALVNPSRRRFGWVSLGLLTLAQWVRLQQVGVETVEAYTLPLALVLLTVGALMMARGPIGSFRALGSGLILALGPSLVIAMADPVSLRALVLGLACALVVLVGALQRWSAPMLIGGAVGVALVLREVGHADVLPQWLVIGLIGVVLTALGVTWERSLARFKDATARLRRMR